MDRIVEFRVLGPLEVRVDGQPVRVGAGKLRVVLAALLLHAGHPVGVDELVDALWPDTAPADARGTVQKYVMRIRRLLGPGTVRTEPDGYRIDPGPGLLDLDRFSALTADAARAGAAGDTEAEHAALVAALALWRDVPPLADVPSPTLQRHEIAALVERHLHALDRRIELDLARGRHADLLGELAALVHRHPEQERFWAHRMRALHRCGRQADALAAYREVAHVLAEELGVDPGAELQAAHREVLQGDLAPPPPPVAPAAVPRQLPVADTAFAGRHAELGAVVSALLQGGAAPVVVCGMAGTGKTALALHAAHRVADRFPDGQLFADLRTHAPDSLPADVDAVQARFLRALGLPAHDLPADADERAATYRSLLAGRRLLVVLDDVADAAQVRALLPGTPGCAVLVTGRPDLAGLEVCPGARRVTLGALPGAEARALLVAALGSPRVTAEPVATAELVRACGGHPLALRVAAAHLARDPDLRIAAYAERLGREDGLAALRVEGDPATDVVAAFERSARLLAPEHRRLLGVLAALAEGEVTAAEAAPAAGISRSVAEAGLEVLAAAGLVERRPQLRYAVPVLVRRYAAPGRTAHPPTRGPHRTGYRLVG